MDRPAEPIQALPQLDQRAAATTVGSRRPLLDSGTRWLDLVTCSPGPLVETPGPLHLDALPLMDLMHGLSDPPSGKDLGLAPPPCMPDLLPRTCH